MNKKFYQQKSFIKLQSTWYEKLEKSGFKDLEWYDSTTGLGQGSPHMTTKGQPTNANIIKNYSSELVNLHRLNRNFLCHGPFYPNLKEKYQKNRKILSNSKQNAGNCAVKTSNSNNLAASGVQSSVDRTGCSTVEALQSKKIAEAKQFLKTYPSFKAYQAAQAIVYNRAQSKLWELHCKGLTIRQISKKLRRLHKLNKLGQPPKRKGSNPKSAPYSIFYVHTHLTRLKKDCLDFNALHPDGISGCPDCTDLQDCQACQALQYLPESNKSVDFS